MKNFLRRNVAFVVLVSVAAICVVIGIILYATAERGEISIPGVLLLAGGMIMLILTLLFKFIFWYMKKTNAYGRTPQNPFR